MREFNLCKELSLKLAKDLGITPFSIGKTSLTHPDMLTKLTLNVSDEDGEDVRRVPIWYGEATGAEGISCGVLAGLDTDPDKLEFAFVLGFKDFDGSFQADGVRLSFHYDWTNEEDPGTMVMKAGDKWLPISLAQRLQLILGFETMIQDGVLWQASPNIPEELRKDLAEIIEVDEKNS
jgi:hypothetical protein